MTEYSPITTAEDLQALDEAEIIEGYNAGYKNQPAPGPEMSRAYHHGWHNGMVDGKHATITHEQQMLARDLIKHSATGLASSKRG
jgi:hypothetical protein